MLLTVGAGYQIGSFGEGTENQVVGANLPVLIANQGICMARGLGDHIEKVSPSFNEL